MKGQHKYFAKFISIFGTILAAVIGFLVMLAAPVIVCFLKFRAGNLGVPDVFLCLLSVYLAPTIGGTIWCAFDILATHVKNEPHDDDI